MDTKIFHAYQGTSANSEAKVPQDPPNQDEVQDGSIKFPLPTTSYSGTRKCCSSVENNTIRAEAGASFYSCVQTQKLCVLIQQHQSQT